MTDRSARLSDQISEMIRAMPVGKVGRLRFPHHAGTVHVSITTSKGWNFTYTLIPGMSLDFVRGEDEDVTIDITIEQPKGLQ